MMILFLAIVGDAACLRFGPAPSMLANGRTTKKPPAKLGGRGFGAAPPTSGKLLDEPRYMALYEWLRSSPLTNLKKVGIAEFEGGLRGVMALQDIMAGEEIVAIPATLAIDLGADGGAVRAARSSARVPLAVCAAAAAAAAAAAPRAGHAEPERGRRRGRASRLARGLNAARLCHHGVGCAAFCARAAAARPPARA